MPDNSHPAISANRSGDSATPEFLRLFAAHQPRIFGYILTLLPNWDEAQEVLQETTVVLWQSFQEFTPGTNFGAWACQVAFHQVLSFRKRQKRVPIALGDVFLEVVSQESQGLADTLQDQLQALAQCLEKLRPNDADLLRRCYQPGASTREVAAELGRPAGTVYKTLTRLRRTLFACIERTMRAEGRS